MRDVEGIQHHRDPYWTAPALKMVATFAFMRGPWLLREKVFSFCIVFFFVKRDKTRDPSSLSGQAALRRFN